MKQNQLDEAFLDRNKRRSYRTTNPDAAIYGTAVLQILQNANNAGVVASHLPFSFQVVLFHLGTCACELMLMLHILESLHAESPPPVIFESLC